MSKTQTLLQGSSLLQKTTLLLIFTTTFTTSETVTSGTSIQLVDTSICKTTNSDKTKCLQCSPNYFLTFHGACLTCQELVPNCNECDELTCTGCRFPYVIDYKRRSSDKLKIIQCQKPYWMNNIFFLLGIAFLPIIISIVFTVCFVDCYYDFQYSKQTICCRKVRSFGTVEPNSGTNTGNQQEISAEDDNHLKKESGANVTGPSKNKKRRGGVSSSVAIIQADM